MTTTKQEPGVLGEAAAPLGVTRWVDASGQALEHFDLDRMPGRFKLIFCFQDACPGSGMRSGRKSRRLAVGGP